MGHQMAQLPTMINGIPGVKVNTPSQDSSKFLCNLTVTPVGGQPQTMTKVVVQAPLSQNQRFKQLENSPQQLGNFLIDVPVNMAITNPSGLPVRWGLDGDNFPLHSDPHMISPMIAKTGEVAFVAMTNGTPNFPPGVNSANFKATNSGFLCQYLPQDGGTLIDNEVTAVLTPSITGCKAFMLRAGDQLLAFHINHGSADGDFSQWKKFQGVGQNICDQYNDFERTEAFVLIDSIFDRMAAAYPVINGLGAVSSVDNLAIILTLSTNLRAFCGIFTDYSMTEAYIAGNGQSSPGNRPFAGELVAAFIREGTIWSLVQLPTLRNRVPQNDQEPRTLCLPLGKRVDMLNPPDFLDVLQVLAAPSPPIGVDFV